jgi:tetratricopeptide (TPR) repeat protein
LQEALEIYVQTKGEKSWEAAFVRASLARVFWATDRQRAAARLFEEALQIIESVLGNDHPFVAGVLHRWVECEIGANPGGPEPRQLSPNALARLERALALREKKLGNDHLDTAETRLMQAECLRRDGHYAKALDAAAAAATVLRRSLPSEHRSVQQAEALLLLLGGQ